MSYEDDYEKTMGELQKAIQEQERIETHVVTLQKRLAALETLIRLDDPLAGRQILTQDTSPSQAMVRLVVPQTTDEVRRVLVAACRPLTSSQILAELKHMGVEFAERANPWALIHGICRRLVQQSFAEETTNDNGQKAWRHILPSGPIRARAEKG